MDDNEEQVPVKGIDLSHDVSKSQSESTAQSMHPPTLPPSKDTPATTIGNPTEPPEEKATREKEEEKSRKKIVRPLYKATDIPLAKEKCIATGKSQLPDPRHRDQNLRSVP